MLLILFTHSLIPPYLPHTHASLLPLLLSFLQFSFESNYDYDPGNKQPPCIISYQPSFRYHGYLYSELKRTDGFFVAGETKSAEEDNCAQLDSYVTRTEILGAPFDETQVNCWQPTEPLNQDKYDNYKCGNENCYKVIDPQFEKDNYGTEARTILIVGAVFMSFGLVCVCGGLSGLVDAH
jgi:hypothetical protein